MSKLKAKDMVKYYWLEFLNEDGNWEIENGYLNRSEAAADKECLIGRYAEWLPREWLRNKDVRIRMELLEAQHLFLK